MNFFNDKHQEYKKQIYFFSTFTFFKTSSAAPAVHIEIMNERAVATGTSVSIKSFGFSKTKNQFVGFGVVGMNIETKLFFHNSLSKIEISSQVINQTEYVFSAGNFKRTTFLNESEVSSVLAIWFVILDKDLKIGTLEIIEVKPFFILCPTFHRFTISPRSQMIQNSNTKHKIWTNISDFQNNHTNDCGNIWTIFPAHHNNLLKAHHNIIMNKKTGNISNSPVIKLLLFLCFMCILFSNY